MSRVPNSNSITRRGRGPRFTTWLRAQAKRADPVGNLATDYLRDCEAQQRRLSTQALRKAVSTVGCAAAGDALEEALSEFRTQRAGRG